MASFSGYIVDYMINAPCNLKCPFCYGPDPHLKGELSTSGKLELLRNLSLHKVKRIVIAGGEPTLSRDLEEVCSTAHQSGIGVSLQTNAFSLDKITKVLPFLDWIAFPLDGITERSQVIMRTDEKHYDKFTEATALVQAYNNDHAKKVKIKVGTVVSKYNIDELEVIASILSQLSITVWKIYKIRKRGKGEEIFGSFTVADEIVSDKIKSITDQFPALNINYSYQESTSDSYIIIDPDSKTYVISGAHQTDFGKIMDGNTFLTNKFDEILHFANKDLILNNINKSFPGWL